MQMKTRLSLLAALLTAAAFTADGGRTSIRGMLRIKTGGDGAPGVIRETGGVPLKRVPEGRFRLPSGKGDARVQTRLTSSGAELLRWLSYADDTGIPRGLYGFEPSGFSLKWTDPLWEDEELKASPKTVWIRDGRICGYVYQILWGHLRDNMYVEYDSGTGKLLEMRDVDISQGGNPSVMQVAAYDLSENVLYGYGQLGGGYAFIKADPETPEVLSMVRPVEHSEICSSLCYNQHEDALYGINQNHELVKVDSHGDQETVFTLPFDGYGSYVTGLAYSPEEKVYYWNMIDGQGQASMVRIDPGKKAAEAYESFPQGETFSSLLCLDDSPDPDRPRRPSAAGMDFPDGSTSGTVRFVIPSETVTGTKIEGDLTYTAYLDSEKHSEGVASPGEELTVEYSGLSDATHVFGLNVAYKGVAGSVVSTRGYVGNDTPLAPQGVTMTGSRVSWEPVTQGVHGAWLDLQAMRYEVYVNGEPAGETSATCLDVNLPDDKPLCLYKAAVKAVCNGMESELSGESGGVVAGKPMEIPVYLQPTYEEFELMSSYDKHGYGWRYMEIEQGSVVCPEVPEIGQYDNWLFLPPFRVDDASRLYTFSFDAFTWGEWYAEEYVKAYLCSSPSPDGVISEITGEINPDETPTSHYGLIQAPAPGTYYVALHCTSSEWQLGVLAKEFRITDGNVLPTSPDAPTALEATAAGEGRLEATVSFDMPVRSIDGSPLPPDAALTAEVASAAGKAKTEGRPGEHVSATVATEQGVNWISVTVSDGVSEGRMARTSVFTGVSIPANVPSVTATPSADMMSVRLEWERPKQGADGGYVNPEDVTFDIYRYEQNYVGWYWQPYRLDVDDTSFTYTASAEDPQARVLLGVASKNVAGTSGEIVAVSALLGKPYGLPVKEDFEFPDNLSFQPWEPYAPTAEYDGQQWQINLLDLFDGDLQTGTRGLVGTATRDNSRGMLGFPRFSTKGCTGVGVGITVLNSPYMPRTTLWGESHGSGRVEIGSINASGTKELTACVFPLPTELLGKEWVQIYLTADFKTDGQFVYVEEIDITDSGAGIDTATHNRHVEGGNGEIRLLGLGGCRAEIVSADGRPVFNGTIGSDDATVPAGRGIYIVKAGPLAAKTLVR